MTASHTVQIGELLVANDRPFTLIAGPCQIESREHALEVASELVKLTSEVGVSLVFKSSFDKANRTRLNARRGVGIDNGLKIMAEVRETFGCPVLTDVHEKKQCHIAAEYVDVIQIPAFLCRQTDLVVAAGETGKVVNIKKGQFLAPWDVVNIVAKVLATGNSNILLTDRGTSFGYNTLIFDICGISEMARNGYPVVIDATHSVQQPGGMGDSSSGKREFVPVIARAALAVGVAAVFMECHPDPDVAPSDGTIMIGLKQVANLLRTFKACDSFAKANPIIPLC
ncbi:3-deoxy-8-phosphooctulonate synthase [Candidatus Endolissoclinum faulkneri L2]|uniref:2-dehydro-3-deoxyphosphooctonate aldolase n=1 Tax=Candidatus Endolissoclinum faulkneri L2 TaxID=1193729 RepID=K7YGX9_9PROT|nr:3-deoxy-8-phosphooctulonate synthase [Candidatus Endolissoclinum faulkneri]AFX98820.1 3-deoxy-8-phosphooctulonate synthase [Candidatus Endolissoclinum faulkneri L2]